MARTKNENKKSDKNRKPKGGKATQYDNDYPGEGKGKARRSRASSIESSIADMVSRTRPKTHPYSARMARSRSKTSDGPLRLDDLFDIGTNGRATPPPASATEEEDDTNMNNEGSDSQAEEENNNSGEENFQTPRASRAISEPPPVSPTTAGGTQEALTEKGKEMTTPDTPSQNPPENQTTDKKAERDNDEIGDIELALKEAAETATIGGWVLPQIPFNLKTQTTATEEGEKTKPSKKNWVQWIPIKTKDLPKELLHHSGNNLDFMAETTISECAKAAKGEPHNLGNTAISLVRPGYKLLFHVVCFGVELSSRSAWMMHAIRSVLDVAKIDFNNALAIVPVSKPGYEWILVNFTKLAYDAFTEIRGLFDPRAQALVLLREWSMTPSPEQTLSFTGLLSYSDNQDATDDALKNIKEQVLSDNLKQHGVSVADVKLGKPPKKAPQLKPINVHLKFDKTANTFVIPPSYWNGKTIRTAKGDRKIKAQYGPRCMTCSSESHTYAEKCPWLEYKVNNMSINANAPALTKPGESLIPKTPKRKQADVEKTEEKLPSLIDARPKKYRKIEKEGEKSKKNANTEGEGTERMVVE